MNTLKIQQTTPQTEGTLKILAPTGPASAAEFLDTQEVEKSSLSALMERLAKDNPKFGEMLAHEAKRLSPLATTETGAPTLTSLRMSAGLTQTELAKRIGQKQSNISLYESGQRDNISRDCMKRLCEALGCDMNTLDVALDNTIQMN